MTLSLATYVGAPQGMSRQVPQHVEGDEQAWTIFDALCNIPGFVRRRGPLEASGTAHTSARTIGLVRVQDPGGTEVIAALLSTARFSGVSNSTMSYTWPLTPSVSPYEIFDAKDVLNGGAIIGHATTYDKPANYTTVLWRGCAKDSVSTTNLASSITRGDTTISLSSGGSSFGAGHFVWNVSGYLVGVVKSVSSNTLTLEAPALVSGATSVTADPVRGLGKRTSKGRITTDTTSAVVNGGSTKFKAQGLASGTWDLFTPDFTYIGTVTSVAGDAQLTLTGNAAVALLNSDYIAIKKTDTYAKSNNGIGWLNAQYAGHQFYAKDNVVNFSDDDDPEALDLTENGDNLTFSSDPIRALIPGQAGLVICSEKEAYALVGGVGTTPDRWRGERIHDDGCISAMGCSTYQGGVIWPGKRGIWFWDGANPVNLVGALGDDYRAFAVTATRTWSMIAKDHYFCFMEGGVSGVFAKTKGASATNYTKLTFVVSLKTGAVTLMTNVDIRGAVDIPVSMALGSAMFGINTTVPDSRTMKGDSLFLDSGTDAYTCESATVGPDFFLETKKYDMGDGQRLKLFKMLLLHYRSDGAAITLDTVKGLEGTGETSTTTYATSTTFTDKRLKFMKRSQYLSFRLYQASASTTRITLGQWGIGFKWKRPGRV